jgi:hypothetical protein
LHHFEIVVTLENEVLIVDIKQRQSTFMDNRETIEKGGVKGIGFDISRVVGKKLQTKCI